MRMASFNDCLRVLEHLGLLFFMVSEHSLVKELPEYEVPV